MVSHWPRYRGGNPCAQTGGALERIAQEAIRQRDYKPRSCRPPVSRLFTASHPHSLGSSHRARYSNYANFEWWILNLIRIVQRRAPLTICAHPQLSAAGAGGEAHAGQALARPWRFPLNAMVSLQSSSVSREDAPAISRAMVVRSQSSPRKSI